MQFRISHLHNSEQDHQPAARLRVYFLGTGGLLIHVVSVYCAPSLSQLYAKVLDWCKNGFLPLRQLQASRGRTQDT